MNDEFNLVHVHAAPAESPSLLPGVGIAVLGAGRVALPILQAIGINYDVTPASALGGGVAAIPAVRPGMGSLVGSVGLR